MKIRIVLVAILAILIGACSPSTPEPTVTPIPTETLVPTGTVSVETFVPEVLLLGEDYRYHTAYPGDKVKYIGITGEQYVIAPFSPLKGNLLIESGGLVSTEELPHLNFVKFGSPDPLEFSVTEPAVFFLLTSEEHQMGNWPQNLVYNLVWEASKLVSPIEACDSKTISEWFGAVFSIKIGKQFAREWNLYNRCTSLGDMLRYQEVFQDPIMSWIGYFSGPGESSFEYESFNGRVVVEVWPISADLSLTLEFPGEDTVSVPLIQEFEGTDQPIVVNNTEGAGLFLFIIWAADPVPDPQIRKLEFQLAAAVNSHDSIWGWQLCGALNNAIPTSILDELPLVGASPTVVEALNLLLQDKCSFIFTEQ
ncbi:MAG: hypothetical protein JNK26_03485 [Candidatus Doudnabacteria bacterium]|nr:hypothetical protein [Candidatus Doudnabacteria bacterium]